MVLDFTDKDGCVRLNVFSLNKIRNESEPISAESTEDFIPSLCFSVIMNSL